VGEMNRGGQHQLRRVRCRGRAAGIGAPARRAPARGCRERRGGGCRASVGAATDLRERGYRLRQRWLYIVHDRLNQTASPIEGTDARGHDHQLDLSCFVSLDVRLCCVENETLGRLLFLTRNYFVASCNVGILDAIGSADFLKPGQIELGFNWARVNGRTTKQTYKQQNISKFFLTNRYDGKLGYYVI
jgi:hypothetical protein